MAPPNRLQALLELSRALSSSLDLNDVLTVLLDRVARLTGATGTAVSRWDRERDVLVTLVHHSHGATLIEDESIEYQLSEFPSSAEVLRTQRPMQVRASNPRDDARERDLIVSLGFRSLLMLALVARGETIGLMEIVDVNDRAFTPQDVEFCQAVCDVVATSLHNAMLYERARELALRDQLTGLHNRRFFDDHLDEAIARAARSGEGVALLVLDLDGLKAINDVGGHVAGDEALRGAADALRASVRVGDLPCRLGGDEFAVILPAADATAALAVAERARRALAEQTAGRFSFSGGVAVDIAGRPAHELYRRADDAAYRAKTAGGGHTLAAA
ncbi:MAG TPA: sensor domain-containing diguanylate cyclase [Gaiellales bacterium]|jgi:diguanylate cyclase (GGDEF)-like protein